MNRAFWINFERSLERMIRNSTDLKVQVELRIDGRQVECATCDDSVQALHWITAKKTQWAELNPSAKPVFAVV
jgi:hypothetical protein